MSKIAGDGSHAPEITLQDLSFYFEQKTVFEDLNLTFPAGQWSVLLGPSGCGKSTLLRIIAGSLTPQSGKIIFGENSSRKEAVARPLQNVNFCSSSRKMKNLTAGIYRIFRGLNFESDAEIGQKGALCKGLVAWMAQDDLLLPWLTVTQNILLGARLRKTVDANKKQRVHQLLTDIHLEAEKDALPETLSGGMRQRVALLRTLMEERPVILMDEPFSALDALTRLNLQNLFARLVVNTTVVLVTHDPMEALRLGHRILLLKKRPADKIYQLDLNRKRPRDPADPEMAALHKTLLSHLMEPEPR